MHLRNTSLSLLILTCTPLIMMATGCKQQSVTNTDDSTHSHDHNHGHHHSEPLFGGQLVEIGHTHKRDGIAFYFAEILPEQNNTIRLYISVERKNEKPKPAAIEASTVAAYAADAANASMFSKEVVLTRDAEMADIPAVLLSGPIPADLLHKDQISLVVPKIILGGERLSFSLSISRTPTRNDHLDTIPPPDNHEAESDSQTPQPSTADPNDNDLPKNQDAAL